MALLCHIRLAWCQTDMTLEVSLSTDREGLLALLYEQVQGAEVLVFLNEKMLLFGQIVPESGEILILPMLSGG